MTPLEQLTTAESGITLQVILISRLGPDNFAELFDTGLLHVQISLLL
jgi:hypothetical protein